mgnify:CR=1 FL=1
MMTLTSFFAMFFMGNTSLYNQLVVRDMVSSNSLNSLLSTLVYILGFTLVIEGIGTFCHLERYSWYDGDGRARRTGVFGFSFYIGILQCWVFHLAGQFGQSVADEGA